MEYNKERTRKRRPLNLLFLINWQSQYIIFINATMFFRSTHCNGNHSQLEVNCFIKFIAILMSYITLLVTFMTWNSSFILQYTKLYQIHKYFQLTYLTIVGNWNRHTENMQNPHKKNPDNPTWRSNPWSSCCSLQP